PLASRGSARYQKPRFHCREKVRIASRCPSRHLQLWIPGEAHNRFSAAPALPRGNEGDSGGNSRHDWKSVGLGRAWEFLAYATVAPEGRRREFFWNQGVGIGSFSRLPFPDIAEHDHPQGGRERD